MHRERARIDERLRSEPFVARASQATDDARQEPSTFYQMNNAARDCRLKRLAAATIAAVAMNPAPLSADTTTVPPRNRAIVAIGTTRA